MLISTYGGVQTTSTVATGYSSVNVYVVVNGSLLPGAGYQRVTAANTTGLTAGKISNWSLSSGTLLSAGTHTISVAVIGADGAGASATVGGDNTSVLQGELNVLLLKP